MKEKPIQCLFDFKAFFKKKTHLLFPGTICFPQYFALAISGVFVNYYISFKKKDDNWMNLCVGYFNVLPMIVKQLYPDRVIKVNKEKLLDTLNLIKNEQIVLDGQYLLLETYLRDEESVLNYRKALLESVLSYHEYQNVNQLINHLNRVKCCYSKEYDIQEYPSSEHYLLFSVIDKNNNVYVDKIKDKGPFFWGPLYWNIFHSVSEIPSHNIENMINFIYVLPFTLPCYACTLNYLDEWSEVLNIIDKYEMGKIKDVKKLFCEIHNMVNYSTY